MKLITWISFLTAGVVGACTVPTVPIEHSASSTNNVALTQELAAYLEPDFGDDLIVDYDLLRDVPTQVGVAIPKYYVWLIARHNETIVIEGAARIAAEGDNDFAVLNFVSQPEIVRDPAQLARIFPAVLISDIELRAGLVRE